MHILRVISNSISFGCIKATDLCGNNATIILHENIHNRINYSPNIGDLLLCELFHFSVFRPIVHICESHLCLKKLNIQYDILCEYFPIGRYIIKTQQM